MVWSHSPAQADRSLLPSHRLLGIRQGCEGKGRWFDGEGYVGSRLSLQHLTHTGVRETQKVHGLEE